MSGEDARRSLEAYAAYLEGLTPERLDRLGEFCAEEVVFRDPFNEAVGIASYRRVLARMFEDVPEIAFRVSSRCCGERQGFLRWRFSGVTAGGKPIAFEGVSELHFDAEGKITRHVDFWDPSSALYEDILLLGWVLRRIRRRLSASS